MCFGNHFLSLAVRCVSVCKDEFLNVALLNIFIVLRAVLRCSGSVALSVPLNLIIMLAVTLLYHL